ncbi:MAG: DNA (cytosine-5-)-methyltransferase [Defluviitaleaceae bacterium]|nr:DNA (cytosine-5-)-methyltransferase [Defluviitaleaceae bacterium]
MITFFDMFAGIGGFRAGLERVGGFKCVGYCEIDPHAAKSYRVIFNTKGEHYYNDATTIDTRTLPNFDLLTAGFPCQAFSIAGKRQGFDDTRGTLFFDIARVVAEKRPKYILLENVPGLLNHDRGKTYKTILGTLSQLGYHVEWQVLNSKDFGVPQSRRRLYIIGYTDDRCSGKVFPIRRASTNNLKQLIGGAQGYRVYDTDGLSATLISNGGGVGAKTGLYFVGMCKQSKVTQNARAIISRYNAGITNHKDLNSGVLEVFIDLCEQSKTTQHARTITANYRNVMSNFGRKSSGLLQNGRIRRLTPRECLRLQGFEETQIDKILTITSDHQAYRQAGNAVTVNVITAIGQKIKEMVILNDR